MRKIGKIDFQLVFVAFVLFLIGSGFFTFLATGKSQEEVRRENEAQRLIKTASELAAPDYWILKH